MPVVFFIIIIAVVVSVWGHFNKPKATPPSAPTTISQTRATPQTVLKTAPQNQSPNFSLETVIKYGPLEKEFIFDTTRIIFNFSGQVTPSDTPGQISFETKLEGVDKDWLPANSNERIFDLPAGFKDYTFLARSKIGNIVDQTPSVVHFTLAVSPYFKKMRISSITPPTLLTPSLINISSQLNGDEKINITGWEIEGARGSFFITQGIEKYDSKNPTAKEDIFIRPGDRIMISSEQSPIWDTNFRPNKCLGYLDDGSRKFTIPIFKNCPRPSADRLPRYLSLSCQAYINNRAQCESVNGDKIKSFNADKDPDCLPYIQANFTYPACFAEHSKDSDFTNNEWHIYENKFRQEILGELHDIVYILDDDGLVIDKFTY